MLLNLVIILVVFQCACCLLLYQAYIKTRYLYLELPLIEQRIKHDLHIAYASYNKQLEVVYNSLCNQANSTMIAQQNQLETLYQQLIKIANLNENKIESMRRTLEDSIGKMQADNNHTLEKMRATVEEKLYNTLNQRLSDSFKIVSERLELVHKGLGEMQSLASGVGDLKRVLTNVKTRGIWGEAQLDAILQQIMLRAQYETNVILRKGGTDRVEYAIKLPGSNDYSTVWLPIDAKFPLEDYYKLLDAQESGVIEQVTKQSRLLESNIKKSARLIATKYIHPPDTTDFAIMFLPIEGLYAEVLRNPGLIDTLQREYRVIITGPTTLGAILNSLQMGFKTLAIERHSSDVWKLLYSIRTEFGKFAEMLSKTKNRLEQASQAIGEAEGRTIIIQRQLSNASFPIQHNVNMKDDSADTISSDILLDS